MVQSDDDNPATLIAACVQFDVQRGDVDRNLQSAIEGIATAVAAGARLCVLPEMWSTSFMASYDAATLAAAERAEAALLALSRVHGLVVVGSSVEAGGDGYRNCARVYDCGALLGNYRKIHLFSPHGEHRHHVPGDEPLIVNSSVGRLGVLICYDIRFPDLARYYFHKGVEVLAVPAQWPEARAQHWRTLLRARAIENEAYVVGCNRTGQEPSLKNDDLLAFPGDGRIIDPTGEVLAAGNGDAGALVAELQLRTVRTMRRILPVDRDQRPSVYRRLWDDAWQAMVAASREGDERDPQ